MNRRPLEDTLVSGGVFFLVSFCGGAAARAQAPFDAYLELAKHHAVAAEMEQLAGECGIGPPIGASLPRYGFQAEGSAWQTTDDLAAGTAAVTSAGVPLRTAEVRRERDGSLLLLVWSVAMGRLQETVDCFDPAGRALAARSVTWWFSAADAAHPRPLELWSYRQSRRYDPAGGVAKRSGHFEDARGRRIAVGPAERPPDYERMPEFRTLGEWKLPRELLRP